MLLPSESVPDVNSDTTFILSEHLYPTPYVTTSSEFNSGLKDAEGNDVENDFAIRASYSF